MKYFRTIILQEADHFIRKLDKKTTFKLFSKIRIAEQNIDPGIFKKLKGDIWEFKVRYSKHQIRVLAFWDNDDKTDTLVIATNGFYKKTQKTPQKEINKAIRIRRKYFELKRRL